MRRPLAALTTALVLTATAACGSDGSDPADDPGSSGDAVEGLEVTGTFGKEPTIEVDGLDVEKAESVEVITGDGAEVTTDSLVLYRSAIANGADGELLQSSYAQPEPTTMVVGGLQPLIQDALVGAHIGSRVAIAAPVEELVGEGGAAQVGMTAEDDVVLVFDLVEEGEAPLAGPQGQEVDPPADAPAVVEGGGSVTGLDFSNAPAQAPDEFQEIPLIEGEGDKVEVGDSITVNYLGVRWDPDAEPFDNSYERGEPAQFQLTEGGLIDGWVKGLEGVTVGSRVMLVIPPELGYGAQGNPAIDVTGEDTLVFLIDVLAIG